MWKEVSLTVPIEQGEWLQGCWVGRLIKVELFDNLSELQRQYSLDTTKLRHLGDDIILISGIEQVNVVGEVESGEGVKYFEGVVQAHGRVAVVDVEINSLDRIDYARVLIKTTYAFPLHHTSSVKLNGIIIRIIIMEEVPGSHTECKCFLLSYAIEKWDSNESDNCSYNEVVSPKNFLDTERRVSEFIKDLNVMEDDDMENLNFDPTNISFVPYSDTSNTKEGGRKRRTSAIRE
ncbi:hypothetical protein Fmac_027248 [Flemingia macrophylla]|uniref:Uncharacterized protein n=1 Tax=Flemingia macrophylla TaxID=520843 RepID=A0ABD1LH82_9FABA